MAKKRFPPPEPADDPYVVRQGDTVRYTCQDCMTEFDLTPEPKRRGESGFVDTSTVTACPFCRGPADHLEAC